MLLCVPHEARAYSVLAHEANIDALWETSLRPLLARRFPRATREEVAGSRAYAYGGAVIQDLGYYPFGSHFPVTPALRQNINAFYVAAPNKMSGRKERKRAGRIKEQLGLLINTQDTKDTNEKAKL